MKKFIISISMVLLLAVAVSAQTTAFSYQGKLNSSSTPANGTYDFKFELHNAISGGTPIGTVNSNGVQVTNGAFTVQLDFGANAFDGTDRFLDISVKLPAEGTYTTLTPRQKLSAVPYSIKSILSDTAIVAQNATSLGGVTANNYLLQNGDGSQLVNVNGAFKWNVITANQQALPNNGYIANSASELAVTLPTNPQVGDVVRVAGAGIGGWRIISNSNQSISPKSWTARDIPRNWQSVASSADGTKLVAVVQNESIYTSADSGVNWLQRTESGKIVFNWKSVASSADGTKLVAVVNGGQIHTSADSGATWTARENIRSWQSVASSADGTKLVAVVANGQIYSSADSGVTWTSRENNRSWQSVASSADGTKLVAVVSSLTVGGQIYTSTDSGVTWTPREINRFWTSVASSSDGTKLVAGVGNGQIYTSADSGLTWTPRENNRFWSAVASSADGAKLIASVVSGQIFTSVDSGINWTPSESRQNWQSVASSADGEKLIATVNGGQIYTHTSIFTGQMNSVVELVYIGSGQFFVVNQR